MTNLRAGPVATAVLAASGLIAASTASAQQLVPGLYSQELPGPYASVGVGANYLENMSANGPLGSSRMKYDLGPIATGALGYALGNGLRGEFQFGYRHSDASTTSLPNGTATPFGIRGNAAVYSYMFNGLYDFRLAPSWWANIGAGVGAATVTLNDFGTSHAAFAYQGLAGIEYGIAPAVKVGLEYNFLGTEPLNVSSAIATTRSRYLDHAVLLTMRYSFGAPPRPPAAVVTPPPAPAPAGTTAPPPPFARDFSVYFATASARLTPEARETVRQAAEASKQNAPTRITVGGHADTVGSASYNQRLSDRRAEAVRKELIADGVPSDDITTRGYGESDLAVPTADNVPEPANRRVVIDVRGPGT
jgi:OOP family OmpA-OmpF porin